jgi:predicted signal transduction protein with EAL and GGDEF domain
MKKVNELLIYAIMLGMLMVAYVQFVRMVMTELNKSAKSGTKIIV